MQEERGWIKLNKLDIFMEKLAILPYVLLVFIIFIIYKLLSIKEWYNQLILLFLGWIFFIIYYHLKDLSKK